MKDLSPQQRQIYSAVEQFPGLRLRDLARRVHWDKPPLSRRLSELIELGWVERHDRRYWTLPKVSHHAHEYAPFRDRNHCE